MTESWFTVLGPPRAWYADLEIDLGTRQQREIFALLVLRAGRVVTVADFVVLLWGDSPPPSALNGIYRFVNSLRRMLDGGPAVICRAGGGYRLELPAGSTDIETFRRRLARARAATGKAAVEKYAAALSLVTGRCGGRAPEQEQFADFAAVDNEYLAAIREAVRLAMEFGCEDLVRDPLARAFELFPDDIELPTMPTPVGDRDAGVMVRPAQLPRDLPGFTGRRAELRRANKLLGRGGVGVRALIVDGIPGVGKTALAVHWARHVAARFPDGQLYADLRDPSMTVSRTLLAFLIALGVPEASIPGDLHGRVRLYHTVLADRRLLLLVDNADEIDDIRPLIPSRGESFVVVTSRHPQQKNALGIATMTLGIPPDVDAVQMVKRRLDIRAPADVVAELVEACGRLPAALAVATAMANTRPAADLRAFVTDFRDFADDVVALVDLIRSYMN